MNAEPRQDDGPSRRWEAPRVLADAFAQDPWAAHVFGTLGARRPHALARIMSVPVAVSAARGGLVVEQADQRPERLVAVSAWVPAGRRQVGVLDTARAGALTLAIEVGPATMVRLLRDDTQLDRVLQPHLERDDAYLWVLGVERRHHGQGLGRSVVERTCTDAATPGCRRILLNTDNPANVAVYVALGFELLATHARPSGLTSHVMARQLG